MSALRVGAIGYGKRGFFLLNDARAFPGAAIVALADPDERAREKFRAEFGPAAFVTADYRELVARDDVDAVFVMSRDDQHEEHAVAALKAGKRVYLEKPLATSVGSCDRILAAAAADQLYVGHNQRHADYVLKLKELIDAGAIGEPKVGWCRHFIAYGGDAYFKDWHAEREKSNGLLLQKGCHDIDVLHWLCGGVSRRVTALGGLTLYDRVADRRAPEEIPDRTWRRENWPPLSQKGLNPVIDVEDVSQVLMELDNGAFCAYLQCHYAPDGWRNYTIIGTAGRVENIGPLTVRLWNRRTGFKEEGDEEFRLPRREGGHGGADPAIIAEFLRFVRGEGAAGASPLDARAAVAAGCAATESLRAGGAPRDVVPPAPELAARFR